MPATWRMWSKDVFGYVPPQTDVNEYYVALKKVEGWLKRGHNTYQIALIWNQGHAGKCKSGTNRFGVKYDSCGYANAVVAYAR